MDWRRVLVAATLLAWPLATYAQAKAEPTWSPAHQRCLAASGQMDARIAECERAELQRQDEQLNAVYRQLEAKLDSPAKTSLRTAQRAWLAFRDSQCAYESSREAGGTLAPAIEQMCLMRTTAARVQDLRRMLDAETF